MSISALIATLYESKMKNQHMFVRAIVPNDTDAKVLEYEITQSWNPIFCNAPFCLPQDAPQGQLSRKMLHSICEDVGQQFLQQFVWDHFQTMVFNVKDFDQIDELYTVKVDGAPVHEWKINFDEAIREYLNSLVNLVTGNRNGDWSVKESFLENDQFFVSFAIKELRTHHKDDPEAKQHQRTYMGAHPRIQQDDTTVEDVLQWERGRMMSTEQYNLFGKIEIGKTEFINLIRHVEHKTPLIDGHKIASRTACLRQIYYATKNQFRRTFNTFEGLQRVEIDLSVPMCNADWYPGDNFNGWLLGLIVEFLNFVFPGDYQVARHEEVEQPRPNGLTERLYSFIIVSRDVCPKDIESRLR